LEIRLESAQTKTGKPRIVEIQPPLDAWLRSYRNKPLFPVNSRRHLRALKKRLGYGASNPWVPDVLRHTAISFYFRQTGSYGRTAEQGGNSEAIIKKPYQGRVSSEEAKKFFRLLP